MKQLDVDVSPPAYVWNHYLTETLVTLDLDPVTFKLLINRQTDKQTDRQTDSQPARHTNSDAYEPTVHT